MNQVKSNSGKGNVAVQLAVPESRVAFAQKALMQQKLEQAGIAFDEIKVFGAIRCNVHVRCLGRDTADKWAELLGAVFQGAKVYLGPTLWNAKHNQGTCLKPTMRRGFLVSVAA
jgi:hypothetical protein